VSAAALYLLLYDHHTEQKERAMSFNKIILVGNLGRDPELRYTSGGTPVCSFTLATNEKRKNRAGESESQTTWFKVTLWGRQAETASQYLVKGKPVYIEGRLRLEVWTDRDGKERHTLEVHATDMQFISSGNSDSYEAQSARSSDRQEHAPEADLSDDDIPF
jgi:single-strand DNA-binding protein